MSGVIAAAACGSFTPADPSASTPDGRADAGLDSDGPDSNGPDSDAVGPPDGAAVLDAGQLDAGEGKLIAFVTGVGYALPPTVAAADTLCRGEAEGRLAGKFIAWFAGSTTSPLARLVDAQSKPVEGPWHRVDGKRIVPNRAALANAMTTPFENPIALTATGSSRSGGVWTETKADGGVGTRCPSPNPTTGISSGVNGQWTDQVVFGAGCSDTLALYCFQVE